MKYHILGGLNNRGVFLEARSLKSRCQHGYFLLRVVGENWIQTSPLALGGLLRVFGIS